MYLDATTSIGALQALPTGAFQLVEREVSQQALTQDPNKNKAYNLEADLEYPKGLHNKHNHHPLASERLTVEKLWMSEY